MAAQTQEDGRGEHRERKVARIETERERERAYATHERSGLVRRWSGGRRGGGGGGLGEGDTFVRIVLGGVGVGIGVSTNGGGSGGGGVGSVVGAAACSHIL